MSTDEISLVARKIAIKNRSMRIGLIYHSDRGIQYANHKFAYIIGSYKVTRSMSRKGSCWDYAIAESFLKSLKPQLIYGNKRI